MKPKITLHPIVLLALISLFFEFCITSCSKANLSLVKDTWTGYYVADTVLASSVDSAKRIQFDCPGDRKWYADTVLTYNNGEPQAVPTTWQEIHPGLMKFIEKYVIEVAPGRWQRVYFIFRVKTN